MFAVESFIVCCRRASRPYARARSGAHPSASRRVRAGEWKTTFGRGQRATRPGITVLGRRPRGFALDERLRLLRRCARSGRRCRVSEEVKSQSLGWSGDSRRRPDRWACTPSARPAAGSASTQDFRFLVLIVRKEPSTTWRATPRSLVRSRDDQRIAMGAALCVHAKAIGWAHVLSACPNRLTAARHDANFREVLRKEG
jgi:hypothetical protein